jgi:hypothetical protein
MGLGSRVYAPSMAFAVTTAARLLLFPTLTGRRPYDAAGFALRFGPLSMKEGRLSRVRGR